MFPSTADLYRVLPELVWCVFGILLMLLQPFTHNRHFLSAVAAGGALLGTFASYVAAANAGPGFFNLVRQHTLQGTFCDPYYGGNADFVGWDLLAYPGIRMFVSEQDEAKNAHPTPVRKSAYDLPMFDRHNAGIADRMSAPIDLAHMPYGMGNSKNGD